MEAVVLYVSLIASILAIVGSIGILALVILQLIKVQAALMNWQPYARFEAVSGTKHDIDDTGVSMSSESLADLHPEAQIDFLRKNLDAENLKDLEETLGIKLGESEDG